MKIVVLDGYTLNPGDLSWAPLESLGECRVYDRTPDSEVVARSAGIPILLTNKTVISDSVLQQLPDCCYVGVLATGYNVVDLKSAEDRGITVTNAPAYSTASVVQLVFAHMLNLMNAVALHAESVRSGAWSSSIDFAYQLTPQTELSGKTLGIIGFGRIGRAVCAAAKAFGMKVVAHGRSVDVTHFGADEAMSVDEVFSAADVLTLHCPLTPETASLVNARRLALMKPTAFVINTSRGSVVDEAALADALNSGRLAGAGLDVLSTEPPAADNPLLAAKNCHITPHMAWATREARQRLMNIVVGNVRAFLAGKPENVVKPV